MERDKGRTSFRGLNGSDLEGAVDIEELHLLLAIFEDGAHDVAVRSGDGGVVIAEGILAGHQGGVADGRGQRDVAAESHHEGIDNNDELHFEDDGAVELFIACYDCLLVACLFLAGLLLIPLGSRGRRGVYIPLLPYRKPYSTEAFTIITETISYASMLLPLLTLPSPDEADGNRT